MPSVFRRVVKGLAWGAAICYGAVFTVPATYQGPRIGAICQDGWRSNATGQGACSHHGGVARWIYRETDGPLKHAKTPILVTGHTTAASAVLISIVLALRKRRRISPQSAPLSIYSAEAQVTSTLSQSTRTSLGVCPRCGSILVRRIRKRDGRPFFGCSSYPRCRFTRNAGGPTGISP